MVREVAQVSYPDGEIEEREGSARAGTADPAVHLHAGGERPNIMLDADRADELGDEIAMLSAHIHAATHRLLVLIAEFDGLRGWELAGYANCARWLAARTGIDVGAAREKVRAARALESLPLTSEAMARGELSFSQVRALTRVADAGSEQQLLELARGATTAQLERVVRAWRKGSRLDEVEQERERHRSRTLSVFPDEDGMYVVTGRLKAEAGALLMRAIDAAGSALFRENGCRGDAAEQKSAQRRADALGLVAERALASGFGSDGTVPISGTRAERFQVVLHVEANTLVCDAPSGRSELADGTRVSAETSRRICCDASTVRMTRSASGSVLDVGRRTRTIPPALRRALEARDGGCRFPGCGLRFTDAHHVRHWADGGVTSLANCLLLCDHHHRLVHEGGWRMVWWGKDRPVFIDPRGNEHFDGGWKPPAILRSEPAAALIRGNERRGVRPGPRTAGARWEREQDIPDHVYFSAMEAL